MSDDAPEAVSAPDVISVPSGTRPRNPVVAAILGLLFGSVAQVYCGRIRRAIGWMLVCNVVLLFVIECLLLYLPNGRLAWGTCAALFLGLYLGLVYDAVRLARSREPVYKWYQRWWFYVGYYLFVTALSIGLAQLYRTQIAEAFYIPTGSMEETILRGDRILADKLCYRWRPIERGDVVVYWADPYSPANLNAPKEGRQRYVKRVVGIPGDTIELRNEKLFRNGAPVEEPYAHFSTVPIPESFASRLRDMAPLVIGGGEYFVMGDNRRSSLDSRMTGCVRRDDIVGKAVIVYWSSDDAHQEPAAPHPDQTHQPEPPHRIRWERMGQRVE